MKAIRLHWETFPGHTQDLSAVVEHVFDRNRDLVAFWTDEPQYEVPAPVEPMSRWINIRNFHTGGDFDLRVTGTASEIAELLDILNGPDHVLAEEVEHGDS